MKKNNFKVGDKVYVSKKAIENARANISPGVYRISYFRLDYIAKMEALGANEIFIKDLISEEVYNSLLFQALKEDT